MDTRGAPCPVIWKYTYYKFREAGIDPHTESRMQVAEHNHSADADMNTGKIWAPDVEASAREWTRAATKPRRDALQVCLVGRKFAILPSIERVGSWLARF